jgi:hypothetical protein
MKKKRTAELPGERSQNGIYNQVIDGNIIDFTQRTYTIKIFIKRCWIQVD